MADRHIRILKDCPGYETSEQHGRQFTFKRGSILRLHSEAKDPLLYLVSYRGWRVYVSQEAATLAEEDAIEGGPDGGLSGVEAKDAHDKGAGSGVSIQRRYPTLQTISGFIRFLGWITIGLGSVGTILSASAISSGNDGSGAAAAAVLIGGLVGSVASGVILIALADLILVAIDIERNTRSSAANDD